MKATGIVRRIDDLGRVVIPKEIRKRMDIEENDPLELFLDDENRLVLQKYFDAPTAAYWAKVKGYYEQMSFDEKVQFLNDLFQLTYKER